MSRSTATTGRNMTPSFRDGPKDRTTDAQVRIGESRDSGFDASHRPGMTLRKLAGGMADIKLTLVVACALVDADKRVLIAQRPEGKALAGLWEFPGGKVEPGERPEQTLIRELHEELGIDVSEPCLAPLTFASHAYETFHLLMPLYI